MTLQQFKETLKNSSFTFDSAEKIDPRYTEIKIKWKDCVPEIRGVNDIELTFQFKFDMNAFLLIWQGKYPNQKIDTHLQEVINFLGRRFLEIEGFIFGHRYEDLADYCYDHGIQTDIWGF